MQWMYEALTCTNSNVTPVCCHFLRHHWHGSSSRAPRCLTCCWICCCWICCCCTCDAQDNFRTYILTLSPCGEGGSAFDVVFSYFFFSCTKKQRFFCWVFGDESTQEPIPQAKTSRSFPAVQPVSLSTYHLWACMVGPEATGLGHTLTKHGEPTIHLPHNNKPCSNAFPELS